ncbi:MAG: hypothetical protein ABIR66_09510 [Saprospiraceae bacterium]
MFRLIILGLVVVNLISSCKPAASEQKEIEPVNISWSKDVPAKHEIINGSAITYNDMIYVISGKEARLMRYNPADYTWMDLAGLPGPRTETGVILWQDKIVVAGGTDDSSRFSRRVDYYDLKDQVWKSMTSLPDPRSRLTLSVQSGMLYVNFGICGPHDQSYTNCLEVLQYDEHLRVWKVQAKLNSGRSGNIGMANNNTLYIIGGFGVDKKIGTVYINHTLKEFGFKQDIPKPRGNFGGVLAGDFILTFGGKTQESNSPMEKYNIALDKWESLGFCPFWTDRFASTRWHDRIYVFGGAQNPMQVWKGDIEFKK